jgi:hypothetical protein
MNESEQLIELIAGQTKLLLQNHWPDILDYLDGGEIKIGFNHALSYKADTRMVRTTISFARRIKDEIKEFINTAQADLPLKVTIEKGGRRK